MSVLRPFLSVAVLVGLVIPPASAGDAPFDTTHKQIRAIKPSHNGKPIGLNTFTLDSEGNILACVGGDQQQVVVNSSGTPEFKTTKAPKLVQRYTPDGTLLAEFKLDFQPTAINESHDGSIYVAGDGKVARLSSDGEILAEADSPHLGDMDELKKKVEIAAKEQMKMMTGSMSIQTERIDAQLKQIRDKPDEEISARDEKRIKVLEEQREMYAAQQKEMEDAYASIFSVDAMLKRSMTITSLAVTSNDVFLCCGSPEGHGYEVWRTNLEFSDPKRVVEGLGGCCGQCDIQANDEHLVLAENTKFQVGLLDRDGNRIAKFGKRDRTSREGFASCCNPMNVRCCSNGDILTAESSIGYIKRFNAEGELLGTIGKANIGGGCKHVALDFDEQRNRYYMQYEDRNSICVLVPLAEAPEYTEDELIAKAAMEGLGRKLTGDATTLSGEWSLTGRRPKARTTVVSNVLDTVVDILLSEPSTSVEPEESPVEIRVTEETSEKAATESHVSESTAVSEATTEADVESEPEVEAEETGFDGKAGYFRFHTNGKLEVRGTHSDGSENEWRAVSQDEGANSIRIAHLEEGIAYYNYTVKFVSDTEAEFSMMYGDQIMSTDLYKRVPLEACHSSERDIEAEREEAEVEVKEVEPAGTKS